MWDICELFSYIYIYLGNKGNNGNKRWYQRVSGVTQVLLLLP